MAGVRARRRVIVISAAAVVALALIVSGSLVTTLKTAGRIVVTPFTFAIDVVAHPVANLMAGAVNYSTVVRQNQQLRAELGSYSQLVAQDQALRQQLAAITAAEHLPFVGSIPTVMGQLTTNSPTNFSATFTISVGSSDGVLAGMPVVANGGLVGMVVAAGSASATVRLITDQASIVGCTFGSGTIDALVFGRGVNNPLVASSVPLSQPLSPGTILTTNGLQGGLYPPGIPVATVSTATLTPGSATWDLTLRPSADLGHLHYVQVLLWEPST